MRLQDVIAFGILKINIEGQKAEDQKIMDLKIVKIHFERIRYDAR